MVGQENRSSVAADAAEMVELREGPPPSGAEARRLAGVAVSG